MKTNEEKLKQLLTIAVENGWKSPLKTPFEKCKIKAMRTAPLAYEIDPTFESDELWIFIHLNNLVTNFEEGEVSFIEALCNANIEKIGFITNHNLLCDNYGYEYDNGRPINVFEYFRIHWTLKPTSERLDWLFETFQHLL